MTGAEIQIRNNQTQFYAGDTVSGNAVVTLPKDVPLSNVFVSFHCLGEVKWIEYHGTPRYMDSVTFYDRKDYLEETLQLTEDIKVEPSGDFKKAIIPFAFTIPKNKDLPSSLVGSQGFIKYFVRVTIKPQEDKDEFKKFIKEQIVLSPIDKNLMVTVGGTVEKSVLLHSGKVSMHASIGRKGFAPGEKVTVHVAVDNKTNAKVVPRISLHQVQIYMCGTGHKTLENVLTEEPVKGAEIAAHSQVEELLDLQLPLKESLSIKSSLITVKYFVRVTLDIPHSFDLHVNLPIVLTTEQVIEQLRNKEDRPELISAK